jgi:hypothetical protein
MALQCRFQLAALIWEASHDNKGQLPYQEITDYELSAAFGMFG